MNRRRLIPLLVVSVLLVAFAGGYLLVTDTGEPYKWGNNTVTWNPAADALLDVSYDATDRSGKALLKRELLAEFGRFVAECPGRTYLQEPDWPEHAPRDGRRTRYAHAIVRDGAGAVAAAGLLRLTVLPGGGAMGAFRRGPLVRTCLFALDGEHVLLFNVHHIVFDGWSTGILTRELRQLYDAFSQGRPSPLPELAIQYADFAHWQRQWLTEEVLEDQLRYWRTQLAELPSLELPLDRPRPPGAAHGTGRRRCDARHSASGLRAGWW